MSDEYEYGPWIGWNGGVCPVSEAQKVQVVTIGNHGGGKSLVSPAGWFPWVPNGDSTLVAYRIATPKPKRELQVGRWYRTYAGWKQCIFAEPNGDGGYFRARTVCADASWRPMDGIDWSVSPRDEAPHA